MVNSERFDRQDWATTQRNKRNDPLWNVGSILVSSDGTASTSKTLTNCKQAELWTLSGVKNLYQVDDKESEEYFPV